MADPTLQWIFSSGGPLSLFDAACPGTEVEHDKLRLNLAPGRYLASAAHPQPDDDASLVVIQLEEVD